VGSHIETNKVTGEKEGVLTASAKEDIEK